MSWRELTIWNFLVAALNCKYIFVVQHVNLKMASHSSFCEILEALNFMQCRVCVLLQWNPERNYLKAQIILKLDSFWNKFSVKFPFRVHKSSETSLLSIMKVNEFQLQWTRKIFQFNVGKRECRQLNLGRWVFENNKKIFSVFSNKFIHVGFNFHEQFSKHFILCNQTCFCSCFKQIVLALSRVILSSPKWKCNSTGSGRP